MIVAQNQAGEERRRPIRDDVGGSPRRPCHQLLIQYRHCTTLHSAREAVGVLHAATGWLDAVLPALVPYYYYN